LKNQITSNSKFNYENWKWRISRSKCESWM